MTNVPEAIDLLLFIANKAANNVHVLYIVLHLLVIYILSTWTNTDLASI